MWLLPAPADKVQLRRQKVGEHEGERCCRVWADAQALTLPPGVHTCPPQQQEGLARCRALADPMCSARLREHVHTVDTGARCLGLRTPPGAPRLAPLGNLALPPHIMRPDAEAERCTTLALDSARPLVSAVDGEGWLRVFNWEKGALLNRFHVAVAGLRGKLRVTGRQQEGGRE